VSGVRGQLSRWLRSGQFDRQKNFEKANIE